MNEKTVLQLQISYLNYRLNQLPQGWIGSYQKREAVIVFSDPKNPKVTNMSRRRYYLNSKKGSYYQRKLQERVYIEAELQILKNQWHMTYIGEPEIIPFPLKKSRFCGILTQQFREGLPNQNTEYKAKNPIIYKGQTLRSKNELLAIQEIENMGFEWKTEIHFRFGKYNFYPDVVFYVPYIDKPIALELDGMMDKDDYYEHAEDRRRKYLKCGFAENKDVIFFRLHNEYDFNAEDLRALIKEADRKSVV